MPWSVVPLVRLLLSSGGNEDVKLVEGASPFLREGMSVDEDATEGHLEAEWFIRRVMASKSK